MEKVTVHAMTWDDFVARVTALAPGAEYTTDTDLHSLPAYRRIRITRWLSDYFEEQTPLAIIEEFVTLGDAYEWIKAGLAAGQVPRGGGEATPRRSGASTRVRLRPILDQDIGPLYMASFDPANAARWRFRGRTIPIAEFAATLYRGVVAQFMVEMIDTGRAVGMVVAYDENRSGLNCKIAFLRCGERVDGDSAAVFEGMLLFISFLFDHFPFRKLFAEVPSYNMSMFHDDFAEHEGVLKEYLFYEGKFVDLHYVSISRDTWSKLATETGW